MAFLQAILKHGRSIEMRNKSTSQATVKNEVLAWSSGNVVPATSSTVVAELAGVSNQTITAGEALAQVPAFDLFEQDVYLADSTNNSNVAHNGQRMVLTDSTHVNNTGTTSATGIVEQVDVFGAATDKKILVSFVTN